MTVTVDSTAYSADATWPSADGYIPANIVQAELSEPVGGHVTTDTTAYTGDNTIWPTADGGILSGAEDVLDALVIASDTAILAEAANAAELLDADVITAEAPIYGGGYYRPPRPFPVVGVGYGVLPEIRGEAFGVVGLIGSGTGVLPGLVGAAAAGTIGVVGRSAAQLVVRGTAVGTRGQAGVGTGMLTRLLVTSAGAVGARGSGSGMIMKFKAVGSGRADDDEAAVMTFLLAA